MRKYIIPFILLILFNFSCLALGGIVTKPGTHSDWYLNLIKAPWTPPGIVFGLAWFTIGVTFAFLGSYLFRKDKFLFTLYIFSWILNTLWNPLFFMLHWTILAGIDIALLWGVITTILYYTKTQYGWKPAIFALPYFIWLVIATSLNWYIVFAN